VNGNASHNIFLGAAGMNIVDIDRFGNILSLATRSQIDEGGVVSPVPEPATIGLLGFGIVALGARRRLGRRG
jgi:hypothetical protein